MFDNFWLCELFQLWIDEQLELLFHLLALQKSNNFAASQDKIHKYQGGLDLVK